MIRRRLYLGLLGAAVACTGETTPPAVPSSVAILTQPGASVSNGLALAPAPVLGLVDAGGNPVVARGVSIAVGLASGTGSLSGVTEVRTDLDGRATFSDLRIRGAAGPKTLRFSAAGLGSAASNPIDLVAGVSATMIIEAGNNQTAPAGTPVVVVPAVRLADDAGNPVPNVPVQFQVAGGGGSVVGGQTTTGADGTARIISWTLGTSVGANQLSVSSGALAATFLATATVGAPAKLTIVGGDQQAATIGLAVPTAPSVKVTDAFDNPVTGVSVTFLVANGGGSVTAATPQTDSAGVARVGGWTLGLAPGAQTLTAARAGTPTVTIAATAIDFPVTALTAGGLTSCARTASGAAFCWGDNADGQIGDSTSGTTAAAPTSVKGGTLTFTQIAAGAAHTCGLNSVGAAFCWGNDFNGQLGINTTTGLSVNAPTPVAGGHTFSAVALGDTHSCALKADGTAWCWGNNANGRLGDSTTVIKVVPVAVLNGPTFTAITVGSAHSCGLTIGGAVYCWGANGGGRLGDGTTTDRRIPTLVSAAGVTFTAVAAGGSHTCAITTTGTAMCWGSGTAGVLGTGNTTGQLTPIAVFGTERYQAIAASSAHTCAVTVAGVVQCWGNNGSGRLGDGTTVGRSVPTPVVGNFLAAAIDLGLEHSCARSPAGSVICWGRNAEGQVGDGSLLVVLRPVGAKRP